MSATYYLVWDNDYSDPVPMDGPFASRDEALDAYLQALVDGGLELDENMTAEDLYVTDDAVRIGVIWPKT